MKPILTKILSFFLCMTAIATLMPTASLLTVSAASEGTVLSEIDARVLKSCLDVMEDDFNRATVGWNLSGGSAEAVAELSEAPYTVYEGTRSLRVAANSGSVSLTKSPSSFSNIETYCHMAAALWIPSSAGNVTVTLSLRVGGRRYETTAVPTADRWQVIFFDLTDAGLSGKITALSLSVQSNTASDFTFLLDCVGAATASEAPFTARYLSPSYLTEGCEVSYGNNMTVTLTPATEHYIEAATPALTDYSGGVGIRVRLKVKNGCRSLTLRYTTLGSSSYDASRAITVSLPEEEDIVSCLFAVPESYLASFRLEFNGASTGSLEILSITASPCYTAAASVGTVTDCAITRDKRNISVKGSLSEEEALRYAECSFYLYELDLWEEQSAVSLSRPIAAQTTLNGREFSFSIPLSENRDELFKKYAVVVYDAGSLVPVGSLRTVNNPELLAIARTSLAKDSIKGFWPATGNYLFDGLAHTALEVRLDRLVTFSEENSLLYVVGDSTCRLNADYLGELDSAMCAYASQDIAVTMLLRLKRPDDLSLASLLCHPLSTADGEYVAFNTATSEGIETLRLVSDFLTRRYAAGGVTKNLVGLTVGSTVNDAHESYNLGNASLLSFTKAYATAFRTVYNAVRSVSASVQVYLPLGGSWYGGMTAGQRGSFDARSTLEAFAACLKDGGDLAWKPSYDIFPGDGVYAYEDLAPNLSSEATTVTAANLEVLLSFLSKEPLLHSGALRTVMLLETEPKNTRDENDRIRRSADYVYTFLRLSSREMKTVTAYLPAHPVDYMDTVTYIDTDRFAETTAYAAELIGTTRFEALCAEAGLISNRTVSENSATSVIPSAVKGESQLFDFTKGLDGWTGSLYCASLQGGVSLDGETCMRARFSAVDPSLWRGVTVYLDSPLDLSEAPYISFRVRAAILPEGIDKIELTVVAYASGSLHRSTMIIPADTDTTVVADLAPFAARSACDGLAIYIRSADGNDIGEPTLLISDFKVMSERHAGADLDDIIHHPDLMEDTQKTISLYTVITIGAVGLLALSVEVIRILSRRRSGEDNE